MSNEITTTETGQTGQKKIEKKPFFEIAKGTNEKWYWLLWSGNGRQMSKSVVGYDNKKDAIAAVKAVKKTIIQANLIVESK